jgi:hypothetical protein
MDKKVLLPALLVVWFVVLLYPPLIVPAMAELTCHSKIVYYGWDSPDTTHLRDHWQEIGALGAFDGIGILVPIDARRKADTDNSLAWQLFSPQSFHISQFAQQIHDLQSASFANLHENLFAVILSSSYNQQLSWLHIGRWEQILSNVSVLGQIMAATGVKNLILDPESYSGEMLFNYGAQNAMHPTSFENYALLARSYGQRFARAILAHVPEVHFLSLYGYTAVQSASIGDPYSLLPAFYDGILNALPPGSTFTDGYEQAYSFKYRDEFKGGAGHIHQAVSLSRNPEAYRQYVRIGFGLWPDYKGNVGQFTAYEWMASLLYAKQYSTRFVWVYSERMPMLTETTENTHHLRTLRALIGACRS